MTNTIAQRFANLCAFEEDDIGTDADVVRAVIAIVSAAEALSYMEIGSDINLSTGLEALFTALSALERAIEKAEG